MKILTINANYFSIAIALVLCVVFSMAFWLTVRNAYKQKRWRRRAADLTTTGIIGVYWFVVLIARVGFGYVGPSPFFTLLGAFVFAVVGVHFLGIAIVQRKQFQ